MAHRRAVGIGPSSSAPPSRISWSPTRLPIRLPAAASGQDFPVGQTTVGQRSVGQPIDGSKGQGSTAEAVVLEYYRRWNARDAGAVLELIAPNCVFEDLVFQEPFVGRGQVGNYFEEICEFLDPDVQFVVDESCGEEPADGRPGRVGILWHAEIDGIEFPFSRGASFYMVDGCRQISFVRDVVEPTLKPGHGALRVLTAITPIVKKLGPAASPEGLKKLPIASGAWFTFYSGYMYTLFFGSFAPGFPVWQTPPSTLLTVLHESINFFYLAMLLAWAGVPLPVPSIAEHPVSEAIFNAVGAWSMMWLPLMVADRKTASMRGGTKWGLWVGTMFLTNVFFIPYMALRAAPSEAPPSPHPDLPKYSPYIGGLGALVGAVSIVWALVGRPEYGGLEDRVQYFVEQFASDRAFFAFCVDCALYTVFQGILMPNAPPKYRWVPLFGLAAYLMDPKARERGG
eukprot:evm.model.scf_1342EXC.1 EVM.evm.TU.scf_1342EXC.1   scf_1342EXC:1205-5897(+)